MSYELDTRQFERGMKTYEESLRNECKTILKKASVSYGERASRYVPPMVNGTFTKSIPTKLYKRDYVAPLSSLVRTDTRNRKMFSERLKQGYRFAVRGMLRGKAHWWFATTLRKARQYVRIFNRGLFKFLFGANFPSIGEKMPVFFQKLLAKSPNLAKHASEHILTMKSEHKQESIKIVNDAWDNQAFARESKFQGEKGAKQTMRKLWKEWEQRSKRV